MLSVTNRPFMLSVVMLNVTMLSTMVPFSEIKLVCLSLTWISKLSKYCLVRLCANPWS